MDTAQDAIPVNEIPYPLEKVIFRIQSKTRHGEINWGPGRLGFPSRIEAVLLRKVASTENDWEELPDATQVLLTCNSVCNTTVAHTIALGPGSSIVRSARGGDKVGVKIIVDIGYNLTMECVEIEMHVRLPTSTE